MTTKHTRPVFPVPPQPYSMAHGGATSYAPFNSVYGYEIAAKLGVDVWEIDLQMSADGVIVSHHDDTTLDGKKISDTIYADLYDNHGISMFESLVGLSIQYNVILYLDIKNPDTILPAVDILRRYTIKYAVFSFWEIDWLSHLDNSFPYQTAYYIRPHQDPFAGTEHFDLLYFLWDKTHDPMAHLNDDLFATAKHRNQHIIVRHGESEISMKTLRNLPIWGVCCDCPELVKPLYTTPDMLQNAPYKPSIVAHRGNKQIAPENTLHAFESALRAGCDTIELDVHITADGELVVFHDLTLDRTANGTTQDVITTKTYADLQQYDTGKWFHPHFAKTRIPTLQQVLKLVKRYDGNAYIDVKSAPADLVVQLVQDMGMLNKCFFWSFVLHTTKHIKTLCPNARIMSRRQDFDTLAECIKYADACIIEYTPTDDFTEFGTLRKQGIQVMIAYNDTDKTTFKNILSAKPDKINLQYPMAFIKFLKQQYKHT